MNKKSCENPDCLFAHFESPALTVCRDFLKYGYCENGLKCNGLHLFICPEFYEKEFCENIKCKYRHEQDPYEPGLIANSGSDDDSSADEMNEEGTNEELSSDESIVSSDEEADEKVLKIYVDSDEEAEDFTAT